MTRGDVEGDPVEVWPDNWQAVNLFSRLGTQWRVGFSGPTGLDYMAVWTLIDRQRLDAEAADEMFDCVQVMERAAMDVMNENRGSK
jgi:hypothetical protein